MRKLVILVAITAILVLGVLAAFAMQQAAPTPAKPEKPQPPAMGPRMGMQTEMPMPGMAGPETAGRQEMRQRMQEHMARMMVQRMPQMALMHKDDLKLSDEQTEAIKQVRMDAEKEQMDANTALRKADMEMNTLVAADQIDMQAIEKKAKEIGALEAELRVIPIRAAHKVMSLITPEQKTKLKDLSAEMIQGMGRVPPAPAMRPGEVQMPPSAPQPGAAKTKSPQ
jgi:Spy/CpxP family protein refolding chaperone